MQKLDIENILSDIQKKLKAPKSQWNSFSKFHYRSCEDILEGLKKVMPDGVYVRLTDEVAMIGDRYYVRATASISSHDSQRIESVGWAREPQLEKGKGESQITGTASTYARKIALSGLFAIDDTKDTDTQDNTQNTHNTQNPPRQPEKDMSPIVDEIAKLCDANDWEGTKAVVADLSQHEKMIVLKALPGPVSIWVKTKANEG